MTKRWPINYDPFLNTREAFQLSTHCVRRIYSPKIPSLDQNPQTPQLVQESLLYQLIKAKSNFPHSALHFSMLSLKRWKFRVQFGVFNLSFRIFRTQSCARSTSEFCRLSLIMLTIKNDKIWHGNSKFASTMSSTSSFKGFSTNFFNSSSFSSKGI